MSNKSFQKKFMHPTRRKLVDMVLYGKDYETDTKLGYDSGESTRKRAVGEVDLTNEVIRKR